MSKSNGERFYDAVADNIGSNVVDFSHLPESHKREYEQAAAEYDKACTNNRAALERERDEAVSLARTSTLTNHSLIATCKALQAINTQWQEATGARTPEELSAALEKWRAIVAARLATET